MSNAYILTCETAKTFGKTHWRTYSPKKQLDRIVFLLFYQFITAGYECYM
jgi:hypothetical protein